MNIMGRAPKSETSSAPEEGWVEWARSMMSLGEVEVSIEEAGYALWNHTCFPFASTDDPRAEYQAQLQEYLAGTALSVSQATP